MSPTVSALGTLRGFLGVRRDTEDLFESSFDSRCDPFECFWAASCQVIDSGTAMLPKVAGLPVQRLVVHIATTLECIHHWFDPRPDRRLGTAGVSRAAALRREPEVRLTIADDTGFWSVTNAESALIDGRTE